MATTYAGRSEQTHSADGRKNVINPQATDADPSTTPPIPISEYHGRRMKRPVPTEPTSPHPRIAKRRCTRPDKPSLRLFTRDFKFALSLVPSTPERAAPGPLADEATTGALSQCVDLALRLLEEGRGNRVLVAMGQQIVAERRAAAARAGDGQAATGIYTGDLSEMPMWVGRFLRQVREMGIPIVVCDSLSGYGLTQRWSWGTNMEDYDCRNSAIVYIHQCLVDGLLESARRVENCIKGQEVLNAEVQQGIKPIDDHTRMELHYLIKSQAEAQKNLDRAVFSISVFLAHEFVHCFTGFLTGSSQPGTPPALNASPYSDHKHGEAGWFWTRHTFGGLNHVWCGKEEPGEPGQFGTPALLQYNKRRSQSFFYQIDHEIVKSIIGVGWAAANSLDPDWFLKLRDETTRTHFQKWCAEYEEIVARNSPTSDDIVFEINFGVHLTLKSIRAVLESFSSMASRLILGTIRSIYSIRGRVRYPSRPSIATAGAISKVKRWGRRRIGLHIK